jgi:co-chaperonin GroES (HSP10)
MSFPKKIIVVGDNIMVRPDEGRGRTRSGLYLPQSVADAEAVLAGWVVEVGPGLAIPDPIDPTEEPWKRRRRTARYIAPQAQEGYLAIFMRKAAVEITYDNSKYLIVPNGAVLALIRDDLGTTPPE